MKLFNSKARKDKAILKIVREVVPWQFAKKEILMDMFLQKDLGIDSLGKLAIAFRLEEEFDITLTGATVDIGDIETVQDLVTAAIKLIEEGK